MKTSFHEKRSRTSASLFFSPCPAIALATADLSLSRKAGNFFIYLYLPVSGTEPFIYLYLPVSGTEPISKTFFTTYVYNFYSCSALFRKSKEPSNSQYCEQTCNFYCRTLDKTAYINEKISYLVLEPQQYPLYENNISPQMGKSRRLVPFK